MTSNDQGGALGMAVMLQTSRFGEIEISPEQIVEFPTGLIGLGGARYVLITRTADATFSWLQSMDDPELAIPVTDPWRFFDDFVVELADADAARIGIEDALDQAAIWVTVRAAAELDDFCANLAAPIVIVDGAGYQVINQASPAPVRAPLFSGLQEESTQAA
jgi:flagellar assembly factor FliW